MSRVAVPLMSALAFVLAGPLAGASACSSRSSGSPHPGEQGADADGGDAGGVAFEANPPSVYVAKVKNILVGLPPTDDEVAKVVADEAALAGLIDSWMQLPEYQIKMQRFFELAFQQGQVEINDFADQAYPRQADVNASNKNLLAQNARESFARTALALVGEGKPFTETMTTTRFMMTPALMELYGFLDAWQVDDAGKVTDRFHAANPKLSITVEAAEGPIPIAETLDPASPNYMHWYDPDVALGGKKDPACYEDPIVFPSRADGLHFLLYGSLIGRKNAAGANCLQFGGTAAAAQLTQDDFSTWKMVTIRPPADGESPTPFYDLPTLRASDELVILTPRVGFFSTPAFFANWQTNTSNQMRVTINQTLIVATGAAIDGTDRTAPPTTPGLDSAHAPEGECFSCHQTLDPTRSILASTYSWTYHEQTEKAFSGEKGLFAFQGVVKAVSSVAELGSTLAEHPLFPQAFAQKLCYYANSSACDASDPEFQRVVGVFKSSSYSWNALVRELLSSPLTTNARRTKTTAQTGGVVAVSRRDHVCAALNARLGFTDLCDLDVLTQAAVRTTIPEIVSGLPSDGYGRGAVAPVLPNEPTLFYRAGMENICEAVAALVVDPPAKQVTPGAKRWVSTDPDAAIGDFVGTIMALTASDPRSGPAKDLLESHFTAAVGGGATPSAALRSTFVVACLAPSATSIGL
jgi:hypothetical protein